MFSVAIIVFREMLEISLIVSVLFAATRGVTGRGRWISGGLAAGVLGALVVAYFAQTISDAAEGMGQELFNASILIAAAVLIAWTTVWMRRYGRTLTQHFKEVGKAVISGRQPVYALLIVVALAVLREGSEIVLFLYGIAAGGTGPLSLATGALLGTAAGIGAGAALYYGFIKVSPKLMFGATSWLLVFLASGMVLQAFGFLSAGGFIPEITARVWDTSSILPQNGFAGKILHALFGYSDRPSGIQLIGYVLTFGSIALIMKISDRNPVIKPKATALVIAALAVLFASPARADIKIYSPHVVKGELEIETQGQIDMDASGEKDGAQGQKYAIGYGVTDWWATEVFTEIEKGPAAEEGRKYEFTASAWENRFQLSEPGAWWIDTGLYFEYEWAAQASGNDKIEGKLLLEKDTGPFTHVVNLILENTFNGREDGDDEVEAGVAWSSRYRLARFFEPGIELQSEFGDLRGSKSWDEQEHVLGPVCYGRIGRNVRYELGYLFGISDAAPDGRLKWVLEWETHF